MKPQRWYFDTSVLVAAAVANHPHNPAALAALEEMVARKYRGFTSGHGVAEVYSVLTRTPFKPPLYPSEAWRIIDTMIRSHMGLVTLSGREYLDVTRTCAENGWVGGRIHDVVHLHCARKAQCDRVLTLNVREFRVLAQAAGWEERVVAP